MGDDSLWDVGDRKLAPDRTQGQDRRGVWGLLQMTGEGHLLGLVVQLLL